MIGKLGYRRKVARLDAGDNLVELVNGAHTDKRLQMLLMVALPDAG